MARKILPLIEAGYRPVPPLDLEDFTLIPATDSSPPLHFQTIRDDLTRGILFDRGRADVLFNALSLSKTRWFQNQGARTLEAPGYHLSFIGFNLRDPALRDPRVRKAILHALPLEDWVRFKYHHWVTLLPAWSKHYSPEKSRALLAEAGYGSSTGKPRLSLRFLTTPSREGSELALLFREALAKVGVPVDITPLESSLFFQRLKKGEVQVFSSRMLREKESDSVADYVQTGGSKNYFSWSSLHPNPLAHWTWAEIEPRVLAELPFLPLFTWKHGLLLSPRIRNAPAPEQLREDSFRFLSTLRLN